MPIIASAFRPLKQLMKSINKIDIDKAINESLKNSAIRQEILDLNRLDQLYDDGITADNKPLGDYSPLTIEGTSRFKGKKEKGQPYDHITLNDTGEFYESFRFKGDTDGFFILAETRKDSLGLRTIFNENTQAPQAIEEFHVDLMTYGKILGLNEKNISVVAGWITQSVIKNVRKQITG